MPFTLSHPAAILPLAQRGLVFSALVVGSMAPDFPYFVQMSTDIQFGHTIQGVFMLDVPSGLLVLAVFHVLLKRPLLSLLPGSYQKRLAIPAEGFRFGPPRHFLMILLSLVLGAFTHLAWDSFTHGHGWVVRHVLLLRLIIMRGSFGQVALFRILQHGSSLVGALLLLGWSWRWLQRAPEHPVRLPVQFSARVRWLLIAIILLIAGASAVAYGISKMTSMPDENHIKVFVRYAAITSVAVTCFELVIFSLLWHGAAWHRKRRQSL